jgi:hypothetical protein
MVGLILGVLFGTLGAIDLFRLRRVSLGVAWVLASTLLLLTGYGAYAIVVASFPLKRWVSGQRLDQTARELGVGKDFAEIPHVDDPERPR